MLILADRQAEKYTDMSTPHDNTGPGDCGETAPDAARAVTWAALLGRWIDFARSAVALPTDNAGRRMRDSVPDVIMLQAVWFALREVDQLSADERALGLDRADVLLQLHADALEQRFPDKAMPPTMRELIDDARSALAAVRAGGQAQIHPFTDEPARPDMP